MVSKRCDIHIYIYICIYIYGQIYIYIYAGYYFYDMKDIYDKFIEYGTGIYVIMRSMYTSKKTQYIYICIYTYRLYLQYTHER